MFYFDEIEGKKILKSDMVKNVQAFFTTRDLCLKSENENLVNNNKKILSKYLDIDEKKLISPVQTHSANVDTAKETKFEYPETDGLILTNKTQAIFLNFADCTPIIFYDYKQNIGAICHAGWRGTAKKIAQITANKLINEYNSKVENLIALIGPAIGMCCYNVGEEVFNALKSTVSDFENLYKKDSSNIYVDLKNINKKQLTDLGVEKIDICPYCTCCDNKYFYSYRKENATSYRHSAVLRLD